MHLHCVLDCRCYFSTSAFAVCFSNFTSMSTVNVTVNRVTVVFSYHCGMPFWLQYSAWVLFIFVPIGFLGVLYKQTLYKQCKCKLLWIKAFAKCIIIHVAAWGNPSDVAVTEFWKSAKKMKNCALTNIQFFFQ